MKFNYPKTGKIHFEDFCKERGSKGPWVHINGTAGLSIKDFIKHHEFRSPQKITIIGGAMKELPKTLRTIYKEHTGKSADGAVSSDDHGLAAYIEGPTQDYIRWLEDRASKAGELANTASNIASTLCKCAVKRTEVPGMGILYAQMECRLHGHLHSAHCS